MTIDVETGQAAALVQSSRWIIDAPVFRGLYEGRGFTQRDIAVAMRYGNNGRDPEHAASHLNNILKNGLKTKGAPILAAAQLLGVDPYEFAEPTNAKDGDALRRAVALLLQDPKLMELLWHLAEAMADWLTDQGLEMDEEAERLCAPFLISLIRGNDPEQYANRTAVQHEKTLGRRLSKAENFELYIRRTREQAGRGTGDKIALDATGLYSGYESWNRRAYRDLVEADAFYAAAQGGTEGKRLISRTFLVCPRIMTRESIARLKETLEDQFGRGIRINIKFVDPATIDRERMSDIGIIGKYAIDFRMLETDDLADVPYRELFIPAADHKRFQAILERLDWVHDPSFIDVVITRREQIEEVIADLLAMTT